MLRIKVCMMYVFFNNILFLFKYHQNKTNEPQNIITQTHTKNKEKKNQANKKKVDKKVITENNRYFSAKMFVDKQAYYQLINVCCTISNLTEYKMEPQN